MTINKGSEGICNACQTIPPDAVLSAEGAEYVEHFCGRETLNGFLDQAHQNASSNVYLQGQSLVG